MRPQSEIFSDEQPRDGEVVLLCAHVATSDNGLPADNVVHWFRFEESMKVVTPDGESLVSRWLCCCHGCFVDSGANAGDVLISAHATWAGDEPAIKKLDLKKYD